jgi:nitroreductase
MNFNEVIFNRRSIRRYKEDIVEQSILDQLVNCFISAPNSGNSQPWDVLFVKNKELKDKLSDIVLSVHSDYYKHARVDQMDEIKIEKTLNVYSSMRNAPIFAIFIYKTSSGQLGNGFEIWEDRWNLESTVLGIGNFINAATYYGLGTCYLATPRFNENYIKELFKIPDDRRIIAVTPLGYPDEYPNKRPRKDIEEIMHIDKW